LRYHAKLQDVVPADRESIEVATLCRMLLAHIAEHSGGGPQGLRGFRENRWAA